MWRDVLFILVEDIAKDTDKGIFFGEEELMSDEREPMSHDSIRRERWSLMDTSRMGRIAMSRIEYLYEYLEYRRVLEHAPMEEELLESDRRILAMDIARDDISDILDPLSEEWYMGTITQDIRCRDDILDL
jgi:hypothetical protein